MTDRTFFKTVISIEVLSEDQIPEGMELENIVHECIDGGWSLRTLKYIEKSLNGKQAARALLNQGSDPSFFQLTNDGKDVE